MDTPIIAAIISATIVLLGNQWALHVQTRKDNQHARILELEKDNRLAFLLENFPPHGHFSHEGITYPVGLDPRAPGWNLRHR